MKITEVKIKVSDIFDGFVDDGEDGVFAYDGRLTIRPPYQREFVYELKEEEAVINTICNDFPLNSMYWALTDGTYTTKVENEERVLVPSDDAKFEVMDGQQRTLSVMYFLTHKFGIENNSVYWNTLPDNKYETLMNYRFTVYVCEGTQEEKLDWFRVVNIAGKELKQQELRNASYTGTWLYDAKKYFSKTNCAGYLLSKDYIKPPYEVNRQGLLEEAIRGICEYQGIKGDNAIEQYMGAHASDSDADELWQYFQDALAWVKKIFPTYNKKYMCGLKWLHFYNKYSCNKYNTSKIDAEVQALLLDNEIQNYKNVYEFVLCKDSDPYAGRLLNLREFDDDQKHQKYTEQGGLCADCGKPFAFENMRGDHIKPWSLGGKTEYSNLQMLCAECNLHKSAKY